MQLLDVNKSPVSSTFGYYTSRTAERGDFVLDLLLKHGSYEWQELRLYV